MSVSAEDLKRMTSDDKKSSTRCIMKQAGRQKGSKMAARGL